MIKRLKGKLNDRGSTLIMVIVTLGFIGILVSVILIVTSNNIYSKMVDRKSKDNFYSAECVIEQIESGIQASMSKHMVKAYYEILQDYDNTRTATYQDLFKNYTFNGIPSDSTSGFVNEIKSPVTNILNVDAITNYLDDRLQGMIGSTDPSNVLEIGGGAPGGDIQYTNPGATYEMTIKSLTIKYTYDNYYSEIKTDLIIRVPDADFTYQNGASLSDEFKNFCLISNKVDTTAGSSSVEGNIWAGKGLTVENEATKLDIKCTSLFAGADDTGVGGIKVLDAYGTAGNTNLKISKSTLMSSTSVYPFVVAKRLLVNYKLLNPLTFTNNTNTNMDITAACIIADDLALEGAFSNASIKGTYTGIGSNSGYGNQSSSIYINGKLSSLNMNLDSLALAGQVSINHSDINNEVTTDLTVDTTDIVTGESISIRGNQAAYLVPILYLPFDSNPIKIDEYNTYVNALKAADATITNDSALVNIKNTIYNNIPAGIKVHLNSSNPIKTYFYKPMSTGTTSLVYFYYNFTNAGAKKFFEENYMTNLSNLTRYAALIPVKEINISSGSYNIAGNYITNATGTNQTVIKGNGDLSFVTSASSRYNNMKSYFSSSTIVNTEADAYTKSAIDELVNWNIITKTKVSATSVELVNEEKDGYKVVVIDNKDCSPYVVENNFCGIVIATGDLKFETGNFTGMFIAHGTTTINTGINVIADSSIINAILRNANMCVVSNSEYKNPNGTPVSLEDIFAKYKKSTGSNENSSFVSVDNMIKYENWEKN